MNHVQQLIIIASCALLLGLGTGLAIREFNPRVETKTVTSTIEVTPQSCVSALTQDNEWFGLMSDALGMNSAYGYNQLAEGINAKLKVRTADVEDCTSHQKPTLTLDGASL